MNKGQTAIRKKYIVYTKHKKRNDMRYKCKKYDVGLSIVDEY